jgi:tetratricopeptide (TPR) repeat protein
MTPTKKTAMMAVTLFVATLVYGFWPRAEARAGERLNAGRTTSAEDLHATIAIARRRLQANSGDVEAAVSLADTLMRLARVESNGGHAVEAEAVLRTALREEPSDYTALKMLGATHLAQHKFRDAVDAANRAIAVRHRDAWNYGVLGDAYLELGEYDRAFAAFDTMARLRPDAAAYARVAYARELQGDLDGALLEMRRAADGTGAHDPESLAWHYAQLGHLYLEKGDLVSAQREYARAEYSFPGHPYARNGMIRVAMASKDYAGALAISRAMLAEAPTPELAATVGDLLALAGDAAGAAAMYRQAEALERDGWRSEEPQPAALARMLAERGLKTSDAVTLAEQAAADRSDIHMMDALAFAYFRAGRLGDAAAAASRALRTGSGDRRLLYHAAAIAHARGRHDEARQLLTRVLANPAAPDAAIVRGVDALAASLGVHPS